MAGEYSILTKCGTGETWTPVSAIGAAEASDPVVLGGKGAGLNEMMKMGLPVPDGFTIHTEACRAYRMKPKDGAVKVGAIAKREYKALKARLGGIAPMVSVRSGAKQSMPGMLSTVCNVGLTSATYGFWIKALGEKTAYDCKRRLLQSYGTVVLGMNADLFEKLLAGARKNDGVKTDGELSANTLS